MVVIVALFLSLCVVAWCIFVETLLSHSSVINTLKLTTLVLTWLQFSMRHHLCVPYLLVAGSCVVNKLSQQWYGTGDAWSLYCINVYAYIYQYIYRIVAETEIETETMIEEAEVAAETGTADMVPMTADTEEDRPEAETRTREEDHHPEVIDVRRDVTDPETTPHVVVAVTALPDVTTDVTTPPETIADLAMTEDDLQDVVHLHVATTVLQETVLTTITDLHRQDTVQDTLLPHL